MVKLGHDALGQRTIILNEEEVGVLLANGLVTAQKEGFFRRADLEALAYKMATKLFDVLEQRKVN